MNTRVVVQIQFFMCAFFFAGITTVNDALMRSQEMQSTSGMTLHCRKGIMLFVTIMFTNS